MRTITSEEKLKLTNLLNEGAKVLQEIDDLKESLKDTVSAVAEELDIKPSAINKALRAIHKRNLSDMKDAISEVEEILQVTGQSA